jgi:AraC family transcriptional regulator of adaptative response / DNA-3-methyladenine glycosylase II
VTSVLSIERDELLRRCHARDRAHDGEFLVGVLTTGIYCLPSCRARRPRPENVRFFPDEDAARSAGLRACKRCRPDDFYRRFDPDRERLRDLAPAVRADPARFGDIAALARGAGLGLTKLHALFRRHFHVTPAEFLVRARVQRAMRLLFDERASVLDAAEGSGFESSSAFHENFRASTGMTPAAYRELGKAPEFRVALPPAFRAEELRGFFGRDERGRTERARGATLAQAVLLDENETGENETGGTPATIELELGAGEARVRVEAGRTLPRSAARAAHERVTRWLGLESDPQGFERRGARSRDIARLVRGRAGLRIPRAGTIFEGLVWVIVGAQVNVSFASTCRAALIELAGTPVGADLMAHPTPADVARLDYADLERRQFSRRKAEYLIDGARAIAAGELDLEGGRSEPVSLVEERLSAVRGLGPWSVQYLCLRAYGFEDCAPIGDVALAEAIKRFFDLPARPDPDEATRRMEPFAPHRSLATAHLWRTLAS